ncbi:DNA ligase D [Saccharothrix violaceirubra]|uniref:DNA ligase (ATP) n=1 Tax=Saccharothrix violaceirubra TaxID=413306 RepID=A0A7W7T531_9PSEU|nr:DNA ligase D [Saccharothrix violaceirubra]MBB4966416.1 bifunctional non-homologous end joining protein LigD [Saccharothrix violaceirubra]
MSVPAWVAPMLAVDDGGRLPVGEAWAYEYKFDGYRAALRVGVGGDTVLTSRNGLDFTGEFRALVGAAEVGRDLVLDGEIVVWRDGRADFELLQERRGRFRKGKSVEEFPVRFLAFDLLAFGGTSSLDLPYDERRRLLLDLPLPDDRVAVVPALSGPVEDLLDRAAAEGYEGLVAKRRDSRYLPGKRSDDWRKHPFTRTAEVVVCGWHPGRGSFAGVVGGLVLGAYDPASGDLVHVGDVGTGFDTRERARLRDRLAGLERATPPFPVPPADRGARWVEPVLVGEVRFRHRTRGAGRLRGTSWRGLRDDRTPDEVIMPSKPAETRVTVRVGDRTLKLSNLDKTLYPDGFTKGEVIDYYSRVAPFLLPHLRGRPVTFLRFPEGVGGENFFQRNAGEGAPDWLTTVVLPSDASGTVEHALVDGLPALVWAANLAALELHVPQWTVDDVRLPDRLVFDLDPGPDTTVVECCRVAERLHAELTADGLVPVAKTSGSKGLQVYAGIRTADPMAPTAYAKAIAGKFTAATPRQVTATMAKAQRKGKVFIDWSQNNPAKTTVAPYSLRGRAEPTASTPVTWDEVHACRDPEDLVFTADDVLDRVAEHGDLFAAVAGRTALP